MTKGLELTDFERGFIVGAWKFWCYGGSDWNSLPQNGSSINDVTEFYPVCLSSLGDKLCFRVAVLKLSNILLLLWYHKIRLKKIMACVM